MSTISLHHDPSGATAQIAVDRGFNCFRWQAVCEGRPIELLWSAPNFAAGEGRPSGSGIPLLFPFPGRIGRGKFLWEGREWQLEPNDGQGNAIHGFAYDRPWRIVDQSETRLTAEFQAFRDDPALRERWPADFLLRATYELSADSLRLTIAVGNPSDTPLPWGLGVHPYFRVPLGGARVEDCVVTAPVVEQWELAALVPTGKREATMICSELRNGRQLGHGPLDAVFHLKESPASESQHARLHDPLAERTLRLSFSGDFRECIIYTPPHREAVCIEPYTCCPDPFRLAAAGADAGGRVLPPGGSWNGEVLMQILSDRNPEDDQVWKRVHRAAC